MENIKWYINRLKTMNLNEILWRISQKRIENNEEKLFYKNKISITSSLINQKLSNLKLDYKKMHLNLNNDKYSLISKIPMLGNYKYEDFKNKWNAGFQTNNNWPSTFSYKLKYKGRDDIGDARTNWELNRHHQFAILAKKYASTNDKKYLEEFEYLFHDWNEKNPFLSGISWTSVMEVAIRVSNWCYAYCFLKVNETPKELLKELEIGILNMTDYITKHYSRYSSANNHLIVEMYAIGQSGILFNYKPWIDLSVKTLTRELNKQNYKDGINKEMSLHYQAFYLEAMGLMLRLLLKNNISVPKNWYDMLEKMCVYVRNCIGEYGEIIIFGDDDDGKILNLEGDLKYYEYVLGMYGFLLPTKFIEYNCENLNWLFTEEDQIKLRDKKLYNIEQNICYKEGGVTILNSTDRKILIGIDHGELGLGKIAAHGHADALSFQMYYKGEPIFVDPGTYIYHTEIDSRNYYRKTENHNTVTINNKEQSEMLGPFLWGKRAKCKILDFKHDKDLVKLKLNHNGYKPTIHVREYTFNKKNKIEIEDTFNGNEKKMLNMNFGPNVKICIENSTIIFETISCRGVIKIECEESSKPIMNKKRYSPQYGIEQEIVSVQLKTKGTYIRESILIEEKK